MFKMLALLTILIAGCGWDSGDATSRNDAVDMIRDTAMDRNVIEAVEALQELGLIAGIVNNSEGTSFYINPVWWHGAVDYQGKHSLIFGCASYSYRQYTLGRGLDWVFILDNMTGQELGRCSPRGTVRIKSAS